MHLEDIRLYCLSKKGVTEDLPFDENTLVFKVLDKIFLLTGLNSLELRINLKCEPEYAIELREKYDDVQPGYHMNKKHWNTVNCEGQLNPEKILKLINHSYDCVVKKMTKKDKNLLKTL